MFRRLFWLTAGVVLGLWGRRRAIDTVERNVPEPIRRNARRAFKDVVAFVNDVAASRESARRAAANPAAPVTDVRSTLKE